ncbi:MAG: SprB repeat-containing protein [Odoribacteraceae bacterium]|nr:SprB repeat-containing protein [Odoribacteraceae bacterium]
MTISKINTRDDFFSKVTGAFRLVVQPNKIDAKYFNTKGEADNSNYLPSADAITLKATKGFTPLSTYNWQYRVEGEDLPNAWRSFPARYQGATEITFKGTDIFSTAVFQSYIRNNTNIQVRASSYARENVVLVLRPCLSAPHIVSAGVHELERCSGNGNAAVKITFDRALWPGEVIALNVDGEFTEEAYQNITELNADHSTLLNEVKSGDNLKFNVTGTYSGFNLYARASSHSYTLTVPRRLPIKHAVEACTDVRCHGGSDGEIVVSATGGTGSYVAELYKVGDNTSMQQITFLEYEYGRFSRLAQGNYAIYIRDTNDCTSTDNGRVSATLAEPAQPLSVALEHMTPPLAHASRDGGMTIRVAGGTRTASGGGYFTVFSHEDGSSYTPVSWSADGADILYTFNGLGRGDYFVTVRDKNYAVLEPQDRIVPCGCEAILNFTIPAPPPLVIDIEETHFVNWHGGNQGELTARVSGGVKPYQMTWYKRSEEGVMQEYPMPNDSIARALVAGLYQAKVTDANGIAKTSAPRELAQPDPVQVQFSIVQTGCHGGNSGKITAFARGGVPPYTYQWNIEGATGNEVSGLEAGNYMLKVTDARGGYLTSSAEVTSSSTLRVDSLVTQPTCAAPGSIRLQLSGATPPYTLRWDDTRSADLVRNELAAGTYRVEITDANGCHNAYSFYIKEPRAFTVDLGDDLVMCRDQSRVVEAVCAEEDVVYEWYLNDEKLPGSGSQIVVDRAGEYNVRAINPQGCVALDRISVRITNETLALDMTVPTTIEAGSEIHAVNLSTVSADRIVWKLPEEAVVIRKSDTELVFSLSQQGEYTVSMEGFKGEGATIVTRTVRVVGKGEVELPDSENPLIKQFWVAPNPSTGYFKVSVELNQAEDFTLTLYSPAGVVMDTKQARGVQNKTFEYEINGTLEGTCLLHLTTKADKSVLQIVIKKQ